MGLIEISYKDNDHRVSIHIRDNGVGISEEKLALLFNIAGQDVSTYGTNNEKGIGIGLMLVKRFCDENKVTLKTFSTVGKGTEFVLSFGKSAS